MCNAPVKRKPPQPQSIVVTVWDNLTFMEGRENIQYPLIRHYISSPTAYIQCVDFSHSDRQAIKANSLSQCRPPGSIGNDSPGTAVAKNGKSNVIRGQNCNLVTWSSPYVFVSLSVVTENLIYWARKPNRVQTETQSLFCWVITTETYKKTAFFSMQDHKRLHGAVWKVCFVGTIPKTQVCWESRHEDSAFVNLHSTKIQVWVCIHMSVIYNLSGERVSIATGVISLIGVGWLEPRCAGINLTW